MKTFSLLLLAGLRLFNPTDKPLDATVICDGAATRQSLGSHALLDFAGENCRADAAPQIIAIRTETTDDVDVQILDAAATAECPTPALQLPLTGCRFGSAIAMVTPVAGATYAWAVEGGTILSGAGTERILIALGSGLTVKVTAVITSPSCAAQTATGIMALHDPFTIKSLSAGGGSVMGQPRTITWAYDSGAAMSQTLTISDLPEPVTLSANARSYTYTPAMYGDKSVVLTAVSSTGANAGRTRAAGRGTASASNCTSVRAEAKFHVDCAPPVARIEAPAATGVGIPFTVKTKLAPGTTATWSIANGTPSTATGESVTIQPLGLDPVDVKVTVSADTCNATAAAKVNVDAALGCASPPRAQLSIVPLGCDQGVITAILTGTPPFTGTWSDGAPFATAERRLDRVVTKPGDYTINNLHDALCAGQTNSVKYLAGPTATISAINSCLNASADAVAVLTFTGTPPFLGEWSDSVAFNTTSPRLERKITGPIDLTLKWFQDANCPGTVVGHAGFGEQGTAGVRLAAPANGCLMLGDPSLAYATAAVDLTGTPPFTVVWADGLEQVATESPALRSFSPLAGATYPLAIKSARDAYCDLKVLNDSVTLSVTRYPVISAPKDICPGSTYTATVANAWTAATYSWRMDHGRILDGQNSTKVTFQPDQYETKSITLYVDAFDPSSCTATSALSVKMPAAPGPVHVTVSPKTIALGQSATVTATYDPFSTSYVNISIQQPYWQFGGSCNSSPSGTCTITLTPKSAGTLDIQAGASTPCWQLPGSVATTTLVVQ